MDFDPKLAILFLLIGAVVSLSHLGDGRLDRPRQQAVASRWRKFVPLWRKG